MKKIIRLVLFLAFLYLDSFSQVQSIRPDTAYQGQTLTTTITMNSGMFSTASAPYQSSDIFLQQGGTVIYTYAGYSIYNIYGNPPFQFDDSLWTQFTIPSNAPNGYYDLHVTTYDYMGIPTDWVLANGFHVGQFAGSVQGDLYFDVNQNGAWDGGEPPLYNHRVQFSPGNYTAYSDVNGHYKAFLDTNTYTVSYMPQVSFTQTSAPLTYTAAVPPSYTGYDFGAYSGQQLYNQYFYVWHHAMRCQPSLGYTYIDITNNGALAVKGSITMVISSNLSLNTAVPAPDIISGDTLTWYYSALTPGQSYHIGGANAYNWLAFNDPPANQTVWYTAVDSVFDLAGNALTQYADSFGFVVSCSCDPNDKEVSPYGATSQHYTQPNSELTYTINFQNTGNDTAFSVAVVDTLDASLDWNTFEVISSTDPVSTQMDANGVVTFTFENILLPDSNTDEPGSHGAVAYRIMTDSLLPDPTVISNTAYIYFDWNPPVITNTAFNTITSLQYPSASFITGDISFCPGSCINYSNLSTTGASYQWSFPGGTPSSSSDPDPSNICYTMSGSYDVQLIATNALGSDTALYTNYLQVYTIAPQAISQSGDTLFANQGFVNYIWYYNGNIITGASNYYYVATQNGDYHVISFDANGCDVEAAAFNVLTSAGSIHDAAAVHIYPNPVKDRMEIKGVNLAAVNVYNILGEKVIYVMTEKSGGQAVFSEVSMLPSGLYTVELLTGQNTLRTKVIKQ
jgi:uncharacterized repeat protein (TIGR01451 family)